MEKYIVNGHNFKSYDEVITYCKKNNFRVTNTETISKNVYLIFIKPEGRRKQNYDTT